MRGINKRSYWRISLLFIMLAIGGGVLVSQSKIQADGHQDPPTSFTEEPQDEKATTIPEGLLASMPTLKQAKGAFIVDGENGQILYQHESDQSVEIASITKLLTVYLTYRAIEAGELKSDQEIWISDQAYALSQDYDIQNVPLRQDLPYRLEDLIEAVGTSSANGASLALAEAVAGSEEDFIQKMEDQLAAWGLQDVRIQNVTGLTSQYDPQEATSNQEGHTNAFDAETVATIAYHLLAEYPDYLKYSQVSQKLFQEGTSDEFEMNNPNKMLASADYNRSYKDLDGLMLTRSPQDGYSMVATAERDGLRAVVVVLGVSDEDLLYRKAARLLDYAFNTYRTEEIFQKDAPCDHVDAIRVENGAQAVAPVKYQESLKLVVPIIDTAPRLTYTFQPNEALADQGYLSAPLKANQELGRLEVNIEAYTLPILPSGKGNDVGLVVSQDIDEASWLARTWQGIVDFTDQSWNYTRKFFINLFN